MITSVNTSKNKEIRTRGYVLRRTNYGEADRILNLITPEGKLAVMAKGVRKERSKLAGGIEMFTLTDFNIHIGRSELGVLTGAKMIRHYGEIVKDLARMELAATMLKRVSVAADNTESAEYFKLVDAGLVGLDSGVDMRLIEAWFLLNLARVMGDEVNLYRDVNGNKLVASQKYSWYGGEEVFVRDEHGLYGADEIKFLRIMLTSGLGVVQRVRINEQLVRAALDVAKAVSKI